MDYDREFGIDLRLNMKDMIFGMMKHLIDHNDKLLTRVRQELERLLTGEEFERQVVQEVRHAVDEQIRKSAQFVAMNYADGYKAKIDKAVQKALDKLK
jgi:hypothetical protein